jgi:predicted transcriptional regulator
MSRYNETKLLVLHFLERVDEATAGETASHLERRRESISMALLRYHRWGLVNRHWDDSGTYVYSISDKGLNRLYWLEEQILE